MCFTVNVNLVKDELESRYGAYFPDRDRYQPSYYYHAFSLPELPAICLDDPEHARLLKWGLIPSWTKNPEDADEIRYKTFNARAETVSSKPSFSGPFRSGRCIIPVKGFFEWQHAVNEKIPWYIRHAGEEIFSLAGLYDRWTNTSTGEVLDTFSIVTTDANDLLAVIHNSKKRMPVILDRDSEKRWISSDTSPEEASSLLKPCPADLLKAWTISNLINNKSVNRNTPEVIRPYPRQNNTLFG
ncbi:MAG: SOS response-associated peptidase [Bacteroidales bacterium]|jgi:putative SOS response-associated peptidase YedK|nr:SOS response-associated peptidase [Bacteroidales bacterium]